jgi:CRISPR/Cas system CMR-associated protein Cmr3 (group 5 of RAMP superfamily)
MSAQMTVTFKHRISRQARALYGLDMFRFSKEGSVVFTDFHTARVFA